MSARPSPTEREWTQKELRAYLEPHGFLFFEGEAIPQGCKYISFEPLTEQDVRRAGEVAESFDFGTPTPETFIHIREPLARSRLIIIPEFHLHSARPLPNTWRRFWYRALLGWKWEKL